MSTVMLQEEQLMPSPPATVASGSYPPPRSAISSTNYKKLITHMDLLINTCRTTSWLESMKSSSPTDLRSLSSQPASHSEISDSVWIRRHPSALSSFDDITAAGREKKIVVFLDYDGTLSPIVEDPDSAFMTDSMRAAVKEVAKYFPTAIVTGRSIDKVFGFVQLEELFYAGSHGMDIKGPTKCLMHTKTQAKSVLFQPANDFLPMIIDVYNLLTEKCKLIPGCKVENNKFCVSVHFRCVEENRWCRLIEEVRAVLTNYPDLRMTQGRKVLEIRPIIAWNKGKALEFLLEKLGFDDSVDILPLYFGDDRTDEDAFKVLNARGQGFGILVSKYPKETNASYSLKEPSEVKEFLHRLADWKRFSLAQNLF